MANEPPLQASLWHATAAPGPKCEPFAGDHKADVAIVGAGFTGNSAALHLAEKGVSVTVLEAEEIGWGGSGRNAGLVNAGMWLDPSEVIKRLGPDYGPRILDALNEAPEYVAQLVEKHGMQADVVQKGVIRGAHNAAAMKGLAEHARQWQERGANVEVCDRARFAQLTGSDFYVGGLVDHRSFSIQPLSYARGLAKAAIAAGARIHERARVTKIENTGGKWRLTAPGGTLTADKLIMATNAYSDGLWPGMRETIIPIGCFMYATEPLSPNVRRTILEGDRALYDAQPNMVFARYDRDGRLIVGTLGYKPSGDMSAPRSWAQRTLRYLFPQLGPQKLTHGWAGTIGFTSDHLPRIYEPAPGVHMALGYNGRGIGPGTYWGKMLAARAMGAPASDFPLPVSPVGKARFRNAWATFYEKAFSVYRLRSLFQ